MREKIIAPLIEKKLYPARFWQLYDFNQIRYLCKNSFYE